jgi:hypothetical protein
MSAEVSTGNPLPVFIVGGGGNTAGSLTNTELRATPVPISGTVTVSGGGSLTDTQLRATPVPISGTVSVSGGGGLTDTQLRATAVPVSFASYISGEDPVNDVMKVVSGGSMYENLLGSQSDAVLGTTGAVGDYLERLVVKIFTSANSAVSLKDGTPAASVTSTTHASTASTTTVINSAIISGTITTDQYVGYLLRINGAVRRITANNSGTGAVHAFTLDHALPSAPSTSVAFTIETYGLSFEILPAGAPVGTQILNLGLKSLYGAWSISTDSGVSVLACGKFT